MGLIRPKMIFNLKSNLCRLVFNEWLGHTWCFGASFRWFVVSLFPGLVMPGIGITAEYLALFEE